MAEQLNAQLMVLSRQALRDPLTQLPNRVLFMDRLKRSIARARHQERTVAVLYLDLDDFKRINDTYGHDGGDQLLLQVAARLQAGLRTEDTAARLGGDEFIVLLDGVASEADAVNVVERLMEQLLRPYTVADARLTVAASIGVALTDGHDANVEDLVRRADAAMYRAKGRGKGQYALYPADAGAV
jgi:diguanylate cyclase (GGDEF)-like protein